MEMVAKEAGVSKATVSRVLNGCTAISASKRKVVMDCCRRLQYTPNPRIQDFIRKAKGGATRNLAFVLVGNAFSNPAYARMLDGISAGANTHRYHLLLLGLTGEEKDRYDLPALLRDERIDGVLLSGDLTRDIVDLFARENYARVVLGNYDPAVIEGTSCVECRVGTLVSQVVDALHADGCRRIAFAVEDMSLYSNVQIFSVFQDALRRYGLSWDPALGYFGDGPMSGLYQRLGPVFAQPELPFDAVVSPDYRQALDISHLMVARNGPEPGREVRLGALLTYDHYSFPIPARVASYPYVGLARTGIDLLVEQIAAPGGPVKTVSV